MAMRSKSRKDFELVIQDDYLLVLHPTQPLCLSLPRAVPANPGALDLTVEQTTEFQHLHGRKMGFDAIYGIFWLLRGPYLALVTQSKLVAKGVDGKEIRLVQKLELMLIPTQNLPMLSAVQEEDERKYLDMLTTDIEAQKLHFAKDYDLTHTLQRTPRSWA